MKQLISTGKQTAQPNPSGSGPGVPLLPTQIPSGGFPVQLQHGFGLGPKPTPGGNPTDPYGSSASQMITQAAAIAPGPASATAYGVAPSNQQGGPEIHVPRYVPAFRQFVAKGSEAAFEAMCAMRHDLNMWMALMSRIEEGIRVQADGFMGPMQPNLRCAVAPYTIGSVAGTTTVLGTQNSFDADIYPQAFIGGQFTTSAVYANNPSRWQMRRSDKMNFFREFDGSTSTLIGVGEEMFGNNLDHWFPMVNPLPITQSDVMQVDVRNEGGTAYLHYAALLYATRYPVAPIHFGYAPNPVAAIFRSGTFTNTAGPQVYTFRNPAKVIAFRGHAQPTAGSITTTAVRLKIKTSDQYNILTDWTPDQLLFGVGNQRTFFLTHPLYLPAGASLQVSWQNDIATSPASMAHNVAAIFQEAR